ncbi:MAG: L-threonylcarbamoyladenylate synthase, partial [Acidimicrobiales bacterium]
RLAARFWPGALTLVVPRVPGFTADLGGPPTARRTVGIRWPDHPVVVALCRAVGPLAVTSANRHGAAPITTAAGVAAAFGTPPPEAGAGRSPLTTGDDNIGPGLVLDGGTCDGVPSTVVECLGPAARCLRAGAIDWASLSEAAAGPGAAPA